MTLPKIKHVRAWFIGGATAEQGAGGGDYHDQGANHWIDDHIATPMSKYKQYEQSRQSFGINVLGTLIVEVEADNGQTGFAVSTAGEMGCFIVEKHLNRFIEGKCVSDIKLIHDQMLNATLYYAGSGGLVMNTISCVDLALWDLFGKVVGLPVYKLLGGAVRDEIQFYATGARPDLAQEMGFTGGKMPTHWGPHDGDAGIRKDVAMVADMREKCGPDFWLMLDCWMSQDVNYATKLAQARAPYNLKWIEECLPPQQYEGYRELKRQAPAGMMVTSGEHHGTLQSFRTLSGNRHRYYAARRRLVRRLNHSGGDRGHRQSARAAGSAPRLVGLLTSCGDHLHQHAVQRVSDDQSGLRHAAPAVRPDPARRAGAGERAHS